MSAKETIEKILDSHPELCKAGKRGVERAVTAFTQHDGTIADFELDLVEGCATEEEQAHKLPAKSVRL